MFFFTKYSHLIFFYGEGGTRVSDFFTKDPNLKTFFLWGGGGGRWRGRGV